jgi:hypothetical protein
MRRLRRAGERGHTVEKWLDSRHAFSFGEYADPKWTGFRSMRVLNEDTIEPGAGYGMLTHRDVEIVTFVIEGTLEQRDANAELVVLGPGDVQRLSAGTGFEHSERNGSKDAQLRYLQMWFVPTERFLAPTRQSIRVDPADVQGRLHLVASPDGRDGSLQINQNVSIYWTRLKQDDRAALVIGTGRHAWVQVVRGDVSVNGEMLKEGDGMALAQENDIALETPSRGEVLVIDLA